jgi:replicative DNA helicase
MKQVAELYPQDLEAEQAVLGMLLLDNSAMTKLAEIKLQPDDFYRESHVLIFSAILALIFSENKPVDLLTLADQLRRNGTLDKIGGPAYLAEIANAVGTAVNIVHYGQIIKEKAVLRQLIQLAQEIKEQCYTQEKPISEIVETAERKIFAVHHDRTYRQLQALDAQVFKNFFSSIEDGKKKGGLPTGLIDLDRWAGGLHPSDLTVIAGRPSMGKTALAIDIILHAILEGHSVIFFSLEMSQEQILWRLLSNHGKVSLSNLRTGMLTGIEWQSLARAAAEIAEKNLLWVDETASLTVFEIRSKVLGIATKLQREGRHVDLVVIDYLQLIRAPGAERKEAEVASITRDLKALAKELNIPVLVLSQLNRLVEARTDGKPKLSDLRESGAIEQDADNVFFIYRPEVKQKNIAKLLIGKQRNGPAGVEIALVFDEKSVRFLNAERS